MPSHYAVPYDGHILTIVWTVFRVILSIVWCFIALLTLPLSASILTLVHIFRYFVAKTAKYIRSDLGKMLTTESSLIAASGVHERPEETLIITFTMKGIPDNETIYNFVYENWVLKKENDVLLYPELQQYVTKFCWFYFWKWESKFDIKDHIKIYNDEQDENKVHWNQEELLKLRKEMLSTVLEYRKSPWEFVIVKNLDLGESTEYDKDGNKLEYSAGIIRMHHCLVDGYSLLKLVMIQFAGKSLEDIRKPNVQRLSRFQSLTNVATYSVSKTFQVMFAAKKIIDYNDWHRPKLTEGKKQYHLCIVTPFPIDLIKYINKTAGVTFTAVILAIAAGVIRKMMIRKQARLPKTVRMGFPYPRSNHPNKLRNHFTAGMIDLPVGIDDPMERLLKIEKTVVSIKKDLVTPLFFGAYINILGGLPTWLLPYFCRHFLYTAGLTNFPGPGEPILFCGREAISSDLCITIPLGNIVVGIGCLSYNNNMHLTIQFDKSLIDEDEVHLLEKCVFEEIDLLTRTVTHRTESTDVIDITYL